MSNLQHIKGSRTRVLNTFPTKTFGNDGDIVISRINGKGVFLCSKAGGMWYAANKMQELNKLEKTSIRELTTNKLTVNKMINTEISADRFVVNDGGSIKYRTGKQVVEDLPLPFDNIAYKTAYCSLGQYSDKDSCESNGGTWYYSENDSHDSISSTPENQLLTVGQSIGGVDAEPTLLYNGSTLEIKYNSDYDDNWQTSATSDLLKLTYDSDKYATIGIDSDKMKFNISHDGEFWFTEEISTGNQIARVKINTDTGALTIINPDNALDYFAIDVDDNAVTTIKTYDFGSNAGHLTLDIDGDLILDPNSGITKFYKAGDDDDLCTLTVAANGVTSIATVDSDGAVGHLTLVPDGDLILDPVSQNIVINVTDKLNFDGASGTGTYITESSDDNLRVVVGGVTMLDITEGVSNALNVNNSHITVDAAKKLYFDGGSGGHTHISESSDDVLDIYVGADKMLTLDEANDKITMGATNWVAGTVSAGTVTEFSAAYSAFAGMILGYTCVGADVADDVYLLTTSYVCFQDSGGTEISVTFKTPPSEYVEIEAELYFTAGSGASDLELTLSNNATYGSNSLSHPNQFSKSVREPARGHSGTVTQKWFLGDGNLAAIGSSNTLYIAAKCDSTSGSPVIRWGGDAAGEYTNLVMKAVALPHAITEGS